MSENVISVEEFLQKKARVGSLNLWVNRSIIKRFLTFIGKDVNAVTREDTIKYFKYLDSQKYKMSYKLTQLHILRSIYLDSDHNPIPRRFDFTHPYIQRNEITTFTPDQIMAILMKARRVSYEFFIEILLLTTTGMRISECTSIRVADVHLEERFLETGFEENARKSTGHTGKALVFCFPQKVADLLHDYLQYHKNRYGNNPWLFPGRTDSYLRTNRVQVILRTLPLNFKKNPHMFRHTFETLQNQNGTPPHIIEILSNHVPRSVIFRNYINISIEERKKLTDQWFPPQLMRIIQMF